MDSLRRTSHRKAHHDVNQSFSRPLEPVAPLPASTLKPSFPPTSSIPEPKTEPVSLPTEKKKRRFLFPIISLIALFIFFLFCFLAWKGITTAQKIQVNGNSASAPTLTEKLKTLQAALLPGEQVPLRGEERGRINILLLGKAGEGLPGENLTDTLMLVSIETKTKKVALISLPRDLYIQDQNFSGKINTFYQKGIYQQNPMKPIKDAITLVTGEPVDYFFVMDFAGFESVVDALGGISVEVPKDFYDPRYPGKNYSYETFELKKGWQQLDGSTALKYVRERHDDPEGDFGRAKRQQQVLQAIKSKAFSPGTYLNFFKVNKLFESVAENVETDVTLPEIQSFYELSKTLDTHNITNKVVDAWKPESLLRVEHQTLGGVRAFALSPRTGTWEETRDLAKNIFEQDSLQEKKKLLATEEASVLILDASKTPGSAQKLARYIERELGIEATPFTSSVLEQDSYPAMLIARGALTKPYSFEQLLKRLPLSQGNTLPSLPLQAPKSDFILIMDERLAKIFQNADAFYDQNAAQSEEELRDTHLDE